MRKEKQIKKAMCGDALKIARVRRRARAHIKKRVRKKKGTISRNTFKGGAISRCETKYVYFYLRKKATILKKKKKKCL